MAQVSCAESNMTTFAPRCARPKHAVHAPSCSDSNDGSEGSDSGKGCDGIVMLGKIV